MVRAGRRPRVSPGASSARGCRHHARYLRPARGRGPGLVAQVARAVAHGRLTAAPLDEALRWRASRCARRRRCRPARTPSRGRRRPHGQRPRRHHPRPARRVARSPHGSSGPSDRRRDRLSVPRPVACPRSDSRLQGGRACPRWISVFGWLWFCSWSCCWPRSSSTTCGWIAVTSVRRGPTRDTIDTADRSRDANDRCLLVGNPLRAFVNSARNPRDRSRQGSARSLLLNTV